MKQLLKKNEIVLTASHLSDSSDWKPDKLQARASATDRLVAKSLGRDLRAVFSDVLNEPVPQRFIDLLNELEKKDKS